MKKLLSVLIIVGLSGCAAHTPAPDLGIAPVAQMPALPATLARRAERLPDITDPSLGGLHHDGVNTDTTYNDLAIRYNALVDAWGCVRQALNTRSTTDLDRCFAPRPAH